MSSLPPSHNLAHTEAPQTAGSKQVKIVHADRMNAVDIHKAPISRIYTKDYSKVLEDKDSDQVTVFLGNPLRW